MSHLLDQLARYARPVAGIGGILLITAFAGLPGLPSVNPPVGNTPPAEFSRRMQMAQDRLTGRAVEPVFTEAFILADVNIDPASPRLFDNFSGDLSGRYIEVMAMANNPDAQVKLPNLVHKLLTYQQPDGRFGNAALQFTEDQVGGEHMALLWGNGRLLVGLMTYYNQTKDEAVLASARRLGDFFARTYTACSSSAISKKLEGFGAKGIICFTQYIEGLVMLAQASGDGQYARLAANTYPVLPPRGSQHTHGFLSTLRGVLLLHEYDHNPAQLAFVKNQYDDLVSSPDYTLFGSVREYFGDATAHAPRDEGCSTADFLRLSLGLYRATHDRAYLDKAEFTLLNALYFNQYVTGDFGAHVLHPTGAVYDYLHSAWWCCTMHGLRAMQEIKTDYLVETSPEHLTLNLYLATDYADPNVSLAIRKGSFVNNRHEYRIDLKRVERQAAALRLRMPPWAESATVSLNGKRINAPVRDGYLLPPRVKTGDKLTVGFVYKTVLIAADRLETPVARLSKGQTGTLRYGPYLMGVAEQTNPGFVSEPNNNVLYAPTLAPVAAGAGLSVQYTHGGYASLATAQLQPVAEQTFDRHSYLVVQFPFAVTQPNGKPQAAPMPY